MVVSEGESVFPALLGPKFRPPVLRDGFVHRGRLHDRLLRAATTPLTLLSAPAGCGKTALVAAWLSELRDEDWAWLSLDSRDDDPVRFWAYFIEALRALVPGVGEAALDELVRSAGQGPTEQWLDSLLNELVVDRAPAYLVIDDLHVVSDPRVRASLTLFVADMPEWLRLIITSRADPPLPLPRLRSEGRLTEIRQLDLRFDVREADLLLRGQGVDDLSDEQLVWLMDRTEGWAAGLQLAAIVLVDDPSPDRLQHIAGTHRTFSDYIVTEVVDVATAELRHFLFTTSVLDRACPSLAEAVSGLEEAGRMLRDAHQRGLFLVALDEEGEWFRYHALFAEALLAEARATAPEVVQLANERAARWYEDHDDVVAAVEYWFAADRLDEALRLALSAGYRLSDSGQPQGVARLADIIPGSLVGEDAAQQLDYAMLLFPTNAELFLGWVNQAEATIAALEAPGREIEAQYQTVRAVCDIGFGLWDDAVVHGMASIDGRAIGDGDTDLTQRAGLQVLRAHAWLEEPAAAESIFHTYLGNPRTAAVIRNFLAPCTWALAAAIGGRIYEAETWCARTTATVSDIAVPFIGYQELLLARAVVHREQGHTDAARRDVEELRTVHVASYHSVRVMGEVELALGAIDDERLDEAAHVLDRLPLMLPPSPMGPRVHDAIDRAWTALHLASGNTSKAREAAQRLRLGFWRDATLAKVHLAAGDVDEAADLLLALKPTSPRQQVTLLMLHAVALSEHDPVTSADAMATALRLASAEGMVQTVVGAGRGHSDLLEPASWTTPDHWMDGIRARLFNGPSGANVGRVPELYEQPTERERAVLRFLASRLTAPEIARELGVTQNTLKTHIKSLYRKLDVASREEAVAAARRLDILS